jgi:hypothetical protein
MNSNAATLTLADEMMLLKTRRASHAPPCTAPFQHERSQSVSRDLVKLAGIDYPALAHQEQQRLEEGSTLILLTGYFHWTE